MPDIVTISIGAVLLLAGLVFCVLPLIPGPIISYGAILSLYFLRREGVPSLSLVTVAGIFTLVVLALDMVMPVIGVKKFNCTKWGTWGTFIGSLAGMFFFPWGLIIGPFLGALIGELLAGKEFAGAAKGAVGAFLGFAAGIMLKLEWCIILAICYVLTLVI